MIIGAVILEYILIATVIGAVISAELPGITARITVNYRGNYREFPRKRGILHQSVNVEIKEIQKYTFTELLIEPKNIALLIKSPCCLRSGQNPVFAAYTAL